MGMISVQHTTLGSLRLLPLLLFPRCTINHVLLEVDRKKLVWYDLDRKKVSKVRMSGIPVECNSFLYTESLLKLTMDKRLQHKPLQQKPSKDKQDKNQKERRDEFLSKGFTQRL
ncbi:hypothetical protein POM88_034250 [Heracleum sosnowskyi]|uniref:Uncharacterized protein n=1 Tax=Heracleum sosnowskyi TaxID=360622 RepID=A0AAD8HKX2_9APIA|nr:hypothetical protein POM88_034250 [Heracleum sosnowskyi]